jgi:MOSC domain-containing protein YiiM
MHLDLARLEAHLDEIRQSPKDAGNVELIVLRPAENEREIVTEAKIDTAEGLIGGGWPAEDGDPARQVTVMNARVVALLAQSELAHSDDRWALAGDQLYVDLDLSGSNLPPGTQLQVGTAVLEVSAAPHRGCKKFGARYGLDALRFVNSDVGHVLNLRGINTRVVRTGVVRTGDVVRKLPPATA